MNRARNAALVFLSTLACEGASTTIPNSVRVVINAPVRVLVRGASTTFTASVRDDAGKAVTGVQITWESRNPSVATVSASGAVKAVATGASRIVARAAASIDS